MWESLVELVRATIFAGSHLLAGSVGASIVVVSTLVRLALLPLNLRAARRARAQQAKLAALEPELARLRRRFASDPRALFLATRALHERHGIGLEPGSILSFALQAPLFGALFSAVRRGLGDRIRFLWIADLGRPDHILALGIAALTGLAAASAPMAAAGPIPSKVLALSTALGVLVFLWTASSAVGLSVVAGSLTSLLQNWLMRREMKLAAVGTT